MPVNPYRNIEEKSEGEDGQDNKGLHVLQTVGGDRGGEEGLSVDEGAERERDSGGRKNG